MNRTRWIALTSGLIALLIVVVLIRAGKEDPRSSRRSPTGKPARKGYYVPPKTPEPPAPPEVIASAMQEARVRSTYQNYRNAVAAGHPRLEAAFRRNLLKSSDLAIRIAEAELAAAADAKDRDIARKALEGLRP